MFVFQNSGGKMEPFRAPADMTNVAKLSPYQKSMITADMAAHQKSVEASFSRQPKITDMNKIFPKLATEHQYVLTEINKLLYGMTQYGVHRGGIESSDGKTYTIAALQASVADLRKYMQKSDSLKGNTEILKNLNSISYGIDLLVPGTAANKEYLAYLNPPKAKGIVGGAAPTKITLDDKVEMTPTGTHTNLNYRRDDVITAVAVDCYALKKSLIETGLTAGLTVALQKKDSGTANEMFDALSECRGSGYSSGDILPRFASDDALAFIEKDFKAGKLAEAERKAKILTENLAYAPQNAVPKTMVLANYGITPKIYEESVVSSIAKLVPIMLQGAPITGSLWLAYDTFSATKKAIKTGEAVDWAKAGAYLAATALSIWLDRYFFGKASSSFTYTLKKIGMNAREEWKAIASMPSTLSSKVATMTKMEGTFAKNVDKANRLLKELGGDVLVSGEKHFAPSMKEVVKAANDPKYALIRKQNDVYIFSTPAESPVRAAVETPVEQITNATKVNKAAIEMNKLVGGVNEAANETPMLFERSFAIPRRSKPNIAKEFRNGMIDKHALPATNTSDFSKLNDLKPGQKVRIDLENEIYIVENTGGKIKVSTIGIKKDEIDYLEKINEIAKRGNDRAIDVHKNIQPEGDVIAGGKRIVNKTIGNKYNLGFADKQKQLNELGSKRYDIQKTVETSYDELHKKLNLPSFDEIPRGKPSA